MIVLQSNQELEKAKNKIKKEIFSAVKFDIDTIEMCYDKIDAKYGPMVIVISNDEWEEVYKKFPILKDADSEEPTIAYEDTTTKIERICYLFNDNGFALYVQK